MSDDRSFHMQIEQVMAFPARTERPGLEIRVNFGIFAGRHVTAAEIDELGRLLVPEVRDVSIVAEERREMGAGHEVSLHQVKIEIAEERLPAKDAEREALQERIVRLAETWTRSCIADRHQDIAE